MTVTDYPTFVAGQALTADELNLLAQHAFDRDRLVGRLIGFGVNGGLAGTLAANTLTITPGLAIDQSGEPLLMAAPWTRTFPTSGAPAGLSTAAYPFISARADTYSVVLAADETDGALIECGEDDCAGHAAHHVRTVKVELVAGRVNSPWHTFADDPILDAEPLFVNASGSVVGDLAPLKAAITAALGRLQPALTSPDLSHFNALAIPASESTAVKAYKVGWINRVLFATIGALRCQMLAALPAIREANPAGVVLGAMERKSTGWEFHCDWRHAWEPPTGLSAALLGGSCANVCGPTRAYLKDALATFAPPPPPPSTPPTGGGTGPVLDWCKGKKKNCFVEVIPDRIKKKIPDLVWEEEIPIPDPGYIDPAPIDIFVNYAYDPAEFVRNMTITVFGTNPTNTLGDGYLNGTPLVGLEADFAKETAVAHMQEFGGAGTVLTVPASQVMNQAGAQRAMAFSPSDTLVLGTNSQGAVVDIAVVPAITTLRGASEISNVAAEAASKANEGLALAKSAEGKVSGLDTKWQGTFGALDGRMNTLQAEFSGFKGSTSGFAVLENRVGMLEERSMKADAFGERISKLEGKAIAQTGSLGAKAYTVDVGNTLAEFAQTAVHALKTIEEPQNRNLVKYIEAVERKQGELELAVRAGDPEMVSTATLELLDNMRTMVGASGVEAGAKRQLDAQFRAMKGLLG
jgi:hypothetical protein